MNNKSTDVMTCELLDRIVDGAISPAELRETVAVLDESHDGWKRLAIAFLEAQCLNEVLRTLKQEPVMRRRFWPRRAAAAATLAASFALGWVGHMTRSTASPAAPAAIAQTLPAPPALIAQVEPVSEPIPAPIVEPSPMDAVNAYFASRPPAISDHARYLLQQQGYEVDEERKIVTRVLPDGRVILAPVDQVRIRQASNNPL